jgi:hypothetical protein
MEKIKISNPDEEIPSNGEGLVIGHVSKIV